MHLKTTKLILLLFFLALFLPAKAQKTGNPIFLKTGTLSLSCQSSVAALGRIHTRLNGQQPQLAMLQFERLPDATRRSQLAQAGVQLLEYLPGNGFTALVTKKISWQQLQAVGVQALAEPFARQKMAPQLWPQAYRAAKKEMVAVWVRLHAITGQKAALQTLKPFGAAQPVFLNQPVYALQVPATQLEALAGNSLVAYVQPQPPAPQPLIFESRTSSTAGLLQADAALGGRGLNGEGVVIGIGDNGDAQTHLDFSGRLINRAAGPLAVHATHVTGIAAGAGILDERATGFAPRATIVSQMFQGIFAYSGTYVQDFGMVLTNNSYGVVLNCGHFGAYDFSSAFLDKQAFEFPSLLHVFAAGNSGGTTCPPFARGYATVLGAYQSAKNVLSVGNATALGQLSGSSSRGPVKDGRLKPEIVAMGEGVRSTWTNNGYAYSSGTSMAAPAVTGGLALLYQRYRQLNEGANPANALMKALLCNGATDLGTPGPDFSFGFGYMNLARSLDMLEQKHYVQDSIAHGQKKVLRIPVPAGTAQLKVMLYWNDPAASHLPAQALVHDLDLKVAHAGRQYLPLVLDTAAAAVSQPAREGADHRNNIEQVVIKNPAAGECTIEVTGTSIALNSAQSFVVAYDVVPAALQLVAPAGGSRFDTSETIRVQWEAAGLEKEKISLQFSANNGTDWQMAVTGIAASAGVHFFKLPQGLQAAQARIRLVADGGAETQSQPFLIGTVPKSFSLTAACEGYLVAKWRKVAGASGYELLRHRGGNWQILKTTTDTTVTIAGLEKDSACIISVRALFDGAPSRRAVALVRTPSGGSCAGAISDGDLKLDALLAPVTARQYTAAAPSALSEVSVRIKNLDNQRITGFRVSYSADGGATWITETVSATIEAQKVYTHHFGPYANLGRIGAYDIIAVVKNLKADVNDRNDILHTIVRHLPNEAIDLTTPFEETFDHLPQLTVQGTYTGPAGLERFDFLPATAQGRLRSFVASGIAYSGNRALTLDVDRERTTAHKNYLQATVNLSAYQTSTEEIRFQFYRMGHGWDTANRVWVRGNEAAPWLPAFTFPTDRPYTGRFLLSPSIRLSHLLAEAGQSLSATTQIRWEQTGTRAATEPNGSGGYTLDNLRLYRVRNDVQLLSINAGAPAACGRGPAEPLEITLCNGTIRDLALVPVRYSVNGGGWITEVIPNLKGNDTLRYTFARKLNFLKPGTYVLNVELALEGDEVPEDNALQLVVQSQGVVDRFPYLQDFEGENDGWYAEGTNSSWELGTPASPKLSRAASGQKVWKTSLAGNHNDSELSYLYSPCLQTGALQNPTLSFMMAMDMEACEEPCDSAWVEYSADGQEWQKLEGPGTRWYGADASWHQANDVGWHVASVALPKGIPVLRLRFVFSSDNAVANEGFALDDVHVYDNDAGIYNGPSVEVPLFKNLSTQKDWTHVTQGGKLLASVQPKEAKTEVAGVRTFIFNGSIRATKDQYYHHRSLALSGGTDSVRVRFYFTENETLQLLQATGCASCTPPSSVLNLGITTFKPADTTRLNGLLEDNKVGFWSYISPQQARLVPFDAGYYLEFDAELGTELWLNAGGLSQDGTLPVKFVQLSAQKPSPNEGLLQWEVGGEDGVVRYEVEVARGTEALESGRFEKLGEVAAQGATGRLQYRFTDGELPKWGLRYYRLRVVDGNDRVQYSPIASLNFEVPNWTIYPNPSAGIFSLLYQLPAGQPTTLRLTDAVGRLLHTFTLQGNGQSSMLRFDLSGTQYPPGWYVLHSNHNGWVFRLLKTEL